MPKPAAPSALPDMDAMMALVQAFDRLAARDPALAGARLEDVIRLVPGKRGIFSGRFGGQAAIFRFYIDHPAAYAARDWAELQRAYPYMSDGDYHVNAPLYHAPELGLVVVAHAEGTPLMDHIRQAAHADRPAYLQPAADWFRKYTAPTEERAAVRLGGWFKRAETALARLPYKRLRGVKTGLLTEMRRIAEPHGQKTWRVAICHGDFHPNNLLADGPRLTAIDTGGSARLPVYKDMARFLSHMARRGLLPSRQCAFGVDRAGLDAFARAFDLDEIERGVWLPFMIGVEALIRVDSKAFSASRLRRSTAFYEALLDDLRGVAA